MFGTKPLLGISTGLLLLILSAPAQAFRLAHVVGSAEIKARADASASSSGQLAQGTLVNTTDTPTNGYYLVRSSNSSGWVRESDLAFKPEPKGSANSRAPASASTPAGAIVSVRGIVSIIAGGVGAKRTANSGDVVHVHDFIETDGSGGAKLLLKDRSVVDLGPATHFMIDEYLENGGSDREVLLSMTDGTVRSAVVEKITGGGKFHLKTPTATMGVRGTEFIVDVPPSQAGQPPQPSKITVIAGAVEVEQTAPQFSQSGAKGRGPQGIAPAKILLTAGQQLTASANVPLPSKALTLDSSALGKISASAKLADNTFNRAVVMDIVAGTASSGSSLSSVSGSRAPAGVTNTASSTVTSSAGSAGSGTLEGLTTAVAPTTAALPPVAPPLLGGGVIPGSGAGDPVSTLHPVSTTVPTGTVVTNPVTVLIH